MTELECPPHDIREGDGWCRKCGKSIPMINIEIIQKMYTKSVTNEYLCKHCEKPFNSQQDRDSHQWCCKMGAKKR